MSLPVIRSIMIASDGSPGSVEATKFASILAKCFGSAVTVAHVLPQVTTLSAPMRFEYDSKIKEKAEAQASKMIDLLQKNGVKATAKILPAKGSVSDSLIGAAYDAKIDLMVAGTRGLGAFRRMILGSVSTSLLNDAACPVLVARKRKSKTETQLKKILVATDGSEHSNDALDLAVSTAKRSKAQLSIVHVVYLPPTSYTVGSSEAIGTLYNDMRKEGSRILSEASKFAEENGVKATTKIIDNNRSPVYAITDFSDEGKFDLIIAGTRGRSGIKKALLGSVANGLAHYSKCSVLITK